MALRYQPEVSFDGQLRDIFSGFKRKGFFNGTVGVIDAILQVFSLFITYVRLWQIQQTKPLNRVYEDIDKKLIENKFKYGKNSH